MKKRILFVSSPRIKGKIFVKEKGAMTQSKAEYIWPPLDLMEAAAFVEKGNNVKIIDATAENLDFNQLKKRIKAFNPNFIVFNTSTPTIYNDLLNAKIAKEVNKDIITISTGTHVTFLPEETLKSCNDLDIIIIGEVEKKLKEITKGKKLASIKGIAFRKKENKRIIKNKPDTPIENIDSLPIPAHHLVNLKLYKSPYSSKPFSVTMTSRGCPMRCTFCVMPRLTGKNYRMKSAKKVLEELEFLYKLGIREIRFWDDIFTLDKKRVDDICKGIIDKKMNISWACITRADKVDEETLRLMKKAGCHTINIGVESASETILKKINKLLDLRKVEKTVKIAKRIGIKTTGYFILGFPWDTKKTMNKTINYAIKLDPDYASFNIVTPFPGTELFDYIKKKGWLLTEDWSKYNTINVPVFESSNLKRKTILKYMKKAYIRFYFRPKYILKQLLYIKNLNDVFKLLNNCKGMVKSILR